jgi:hypothetical protein
MNFFQRSRLLKKVNSLDLTPLRLLDHTDEEGARVSLLMPRFHATIWKPLFQHRTRRKFIPIKLDEFGSATWLLMDGSTKVSGIAAKLREQFPEKLQPGDDTETRVANFIFMLYNQRYITFREIQNQPSNI